MKHYVKSNLRWPGGKSRIVGILDEYLPVTIDKYIETFTGGGSVLLHIIQSKNPETIYANDINPNLINYYKEIIEHPDEVIRDCLQLKQEYTAETFRERFSQLELGTASGFFTANKCSFSGIFNSYSETSFDLNFTVNCINSIKDISRILQNSNFITGDYRNLTESINEPIEDFFIYLDPPYFGNASIGLYGENGRLHKDFDHISMFEWVTEMSKKNKVMISYDDSPYIRDLYKDFNIHDFSIKYTMTNTGGNNCKTGKEIIITNYEHIPTEPPLW